MRHFDREVVVTRWTPKDVKDAAIERVAAGETVSLVARDVGVGPDTVYVWLRGKRCRTSWQACESSA